MRDFLCFLLILTLPAASDELFEREIRPLLAAHCYRCHSTESGKARGGLRVDSLEALLRGGDSGPALVPGEADASRLYQALLYGPDSDQMPPAGKLPDADIATVRAWITAGAPAPRAEHAPELQSTIDIAAGRAHWAYRPLARTPGPAAEGWARTALDAFVAEARAARGLEPVGDAAPEVLVRRLFFVLSGLPPTPEQAEAWRKRIARDREEVAALVDELLASPAYGERWGRHWLDVARFAESTGGDRNNLHPHAWRYRDAVIDAFNADLPFDDFVRLQLAGDLVPAEDPAERARNAVLTGFLALGVKSVGEEDREQFAADLVDEQIDATSRAFLATTAACARCHDHKYDPIPQRDYYALAGIFRATDTRYGLIPAQARHPTPLLELTGLGQDATGPALDQEQLAALLRARDEARAAVDEAMRKIRGGENVFRGTLRRLRSQRAEAEAAVEAYAADGTAKVLAMGAVEGRPRETRLLVRGEVDQPAQVVPRGLLAVLSEPGAHVLDSAGSGRRELAEWIVGSPLTARVIANRVWHWMVGRGLVRTVDDFGRSGEEPSHPALLDYLARRLIEEGWSLKALIREIALSRTWQLSAEHDPERIAVDPENIFLWRMAPRRLEAEALRDALLAVSGKLDRTRPPGSFLAPLGEGGVGQNVFAPDIRALDPPVRAVYLPRVRGVMPAMLELFDAPDASVVRGARDVTVSPLQGLFLLNNPLVQGAALALAAQLAELAPKEQVERAYAILFARAPTSRERRLGTRFLARTLAPPAAAEEPTPESSGGRGRGRGRGRSPEPPPETAPPAPMSTLAAYCQALMATMEFQVIE